MSSHCDCTQVINCITELMRICCGLHAPVASSRVSAGCPSFSSQLWHRRDLPLLVSCRIRTETEGEGCKLSYEHMGKKQKDLLLNSIELWWFMSPADQVLNVQKQTAKGGLGQLEQIQLCNTHSAPVWPQASFVKAAATIPFSPQHWSWQLLMYEAHHKLIIRFQFMFAWLAVRGSLILMCKL